MKNPFETFGLTPELAAKLDEKDLFALVRAMYRGLQKVYHPDRGGAKKPKEQRESAAQAVELNLAFEQLNLDRAPQSFRKFHKNYKARKKRGLSSKVTALEKELREVRSRGESLGDAYMNHLIRGLPWMSMNGTDSRLIHPVPANLKLGLNDVAINQNVRSASWSLGSNYKEIVFDALGAMYYRPVGRAKPFQVNFIQILGVIGMDEIDLIPLLDRTTPKEGFFKSPALDSRYGIDGAPLEVLNTLRLDKFKNHCLALLKPNLSERAYLFSIHRPLFEEEGRISLEGVIVKISNL